MMVELPQITDDLAQAERDLRDTGICLVGGAIEPEQLERAHEALYRAAVDDRARGAEQTGFALDYGMHHQRVWNVLSRDLVFADLVQHPSALKLIHATLGGAALLGNLSANLAEPGCEGGLLHAD